MKPWMIVVMAGSVACNGDADVDTDIAGDTDVVDTDVADTDVPDRDVEVASVSGTLTWLVDFSVEAEAAGYADCTYTRTYTDGVEIRHSPWTCVDCEAVVRVESALTEGRDCYDLISPNEPAPQEHLGWGGGRFWRTYYANYRLSDQGSATIEGTSLTTLNETPFEFEDSAGARWSAQFTVTGALELSTVTADPMEGLYAPSTYECGWPTANPPAYEGDHVLRLGETVPDGLFRDACGEPMRLHDLKGRWLVIDAAATDCGPCQAMAEDAPGFEAEMANLGLEVTGVTLLAPSLSNSLGDTSTSTLYDWGFAFDLEGPVLADRGYGAWVLGTGAETITGESFGYPTWVVVNPELEVVAVNVGFGGWDSIKQVILDNR